MNREALIEVLAKALREAAAEAVMFPEIAEGMAPAVVEFVAQWLEALPLDAPMAAQISDRWREEMGQ